MALRFTFYVLRFTRNGLLGSSQGRKALARISRSVQRSDIQIVHRFVTLRKGLKPHGFSRLATSPTSYNRFRLAGVPASTHEPQVVRHTMLDLGRRSQPAHLPGFVS